ncbi:MAG: excinuclease ABC subunit UvrC [Myxococcota bacterium]|nr:excinuclease ABC subunit UvrC [Myxococcota bacterium]
MKFDAADILTRLPDKPGVYLMKDESKKVIYVGKASNLRARVRQYFGASSDTRYFVHLLEDYLDDIEVIITTNEKEALILENELIKRYQPRFNVVLKDDKNFLHIKIDHRVPWPRIDIVRRPKNDGARYFGPFHSASKVRATIKLIERYFGLRNCDDLAFKNRSRPCLQYQIKRCPGPCVLPVDPDDYQQRVEDVSLFLKGRNEDLLAILQTKMSEASSEMNYETAARYRDQIQAVRGSLEAQKMVRFNGVDRDVFGLYREGGHLHLTIMLIRGGRMVGAKNFGFDRQGVDDAEVLSTVCNLYYSGGATIPDEVFLPVLPESVSALSELLSETKGRLVKVHQPRRADGRRLLELAEKNAEHGFFQARREEAQRNGGLARLKGTLRLSNMPYRIECYDISLFQGAEAVGSKVVFEGGVPHRKGYRHYRIKSVDGTDDYAMMREMLTRRLTRGLAEQDLPDLIVVDGGKGQLNVARLVMADLNITGVDLVSIAKARVIGRNEDDGLVKSAERIFVPGVKAPIALRAHTDELFLMTHLRDEAHRFAISFHRKRRRKRTLTSELDRLSGIGPARRKALLRAFGSVKALRQATLDELSAVDGIGPKMAKGLYEQLRESTTNR